MAIVNAIKGIKTEFLGDADEIVCTFSPVARNGVQVEVEGFTLNNATIETKGGSSTDPDETPVTGALHVAVINGPNGRSNIGEVRISGVAAGEYNVTFIEL